MSASCKKTLTPAQFERSERNKQKALILRNARLSKRPYPERKHRAKAQKAAEDSRAGFLIDPDEEADCEERVRLVEDRAPLLGVGPQWGPICQECQKSFTDSYMLLKFKEPVCDGCRDNDGKHELVTRTDAKQAITSILTPSSRSKAMTGHLAIPPQRL
eukprot:m.30633 g.30633  ORF g.30633 m.30633 type:complete len:159 (+) comp31368_c0_seq12:38-514(+)